MARAVCRNIGAAEVHHVKGGVLVESSLPSNARSGKGTFKEFEHDGWQSVAEGYHDHFASLTMQTINPLLDAVQARLDARLLDVATGPGYVAAAAARRGCEVTGLDFSSVMVERARRENPGITFIEGDAEKLPFPEQAFELLTMNFGLLHLSNPDEAIRESSRVLSRAGRAAFTVWALPSRARAFAVVLEAIEKYGDKGIALPAGPPFFQFSDASVFERAMQSAGFQEVAFSEVVMTWTLPSAEALFDAFFTGTPRTGGILRAQPEPNLKEIKAEVQAEARRQFGTTGDGLSIPMASLLAVGTRR